MYEPSYFIVPDAPAAARQLLSADPLVTLCRVDAQGLPQADAVPMLWGQADDPLSAAQPFAARSRDDDPLGAMLIGHVARANPLASLTGAVPALAIVHGVDGYISPGWYPSKARDPRHVPTWNYELAQIRGTLEVVHEDAWIDAVVRRLSAHFEAPRAQAWQVDDAPASYLQATRRAIVGIRLRVEDVRVKAKLSQNRSAEDRQGVVRGLRAEAADWGAPAARIALAERMERGG